MTFEPEKLESDEWGKEFTHLQGYTSFENYWAEANEILDAAVSSPTSTPEKVIRISRVFESLRATGLKHALVAQWYFRSVLVPIGAVESMGWPALCGKDLSEDEKTDHPLRGRHYEYEPTPPGDQNPAFRSRDPEWAQFRPFSKFRIFLDTDCQEKSLISLAEDQTSLAEAKTNVFLQRLLALAEYAVDSGEAEDRNVAFARHYFEVYQATDPRPKHDEIEMRFRRCLNCTRDEARKLIGECRPESWRDGRSG